MRFTKYLAVVVMAVAVAVLVPAAHADSFNFSVQNGGIIPNAASFGTVTVTCNAGGTSCTLDFLAASNYMFHNGGVGFNIGLDAGDTLNPTPTVTCTPAVGSPACTFVSTSQQFDGFGSFTDSVSGGNGSSSGNAEIVITFTGAGLSTNEFEIGTNKFAAAISPTAGCAAGVGSCTGFAATTGSIHNDVPEPSSIALLGMGVVGLLGLRRKRVTA